MHRRPPHGNPVARSLVVVVLLAGLGGTLTSSRIVPPAPVETFTVTSGTLEAALPDWPEPAGRPAHRRARALPAAGTPVWMRIPRLGVSAPVQPVSAPGGVLVPPSDPQTLGWWSQGAEPGARSGTAVIAGHTVSTGGGALDDLRLLTPGDRIVVRTERGRIRFVVGEVAYYDKPDLARLSAELFSRRTPGRLAVVTCARYDGDEYLGNTVVLARPRA